jgi:hypothetical protein
MSEFNPNPEGFNPAVKLNLPESEPQGPKCPECGITKKDNRTLGLHRRNEHGVSGRGRATTAKKRGRPPGAKNRAKAEASTQQVRVHLVEVYHSGDGRILLQDDDGEWWGARRLRF